MAVKVLFTFNYGKDNMKKINELGYDCTFVDERAAAYSEAIKDTEVLVCYNPFTTLDISLLQNLKYIQLSSVGIDQLPINIVKNKGIIVTNNKGGYSIPMGEWIVMKILELLKHSFRMYKNQQNKLWKMDTGIAELYGKTVGFIGTGSIAIEAAKRLQGFEVKILGTNTNGRKQDYFQQCFSMDELDSMLSQCDTVVVTIPSTKETFHLLSEDKLSKVKQGALLINVARGNIIDEAALTKCLINGRLGGAALDVFEKEPLSESNMLWELQNVSITPHNSWVSEMRNTRRWNVIYENLRRYINKEALINSVDLEKGY